VSFQAPDSLKDERYGKYQYTYCLAVS